jgi:EmrB/QacA subfamily drug resistance transporter
MTLLTASSVCSMIVLDTNIVAVSLPSIARSLHASFADIEWVVSAYMMVFAALLMPAGGLADRFGRRRMMLIGLGVFLIASVLCGAADSSLVLNAGRALQGVGAAMLLTSALAVIGHTFQSEMERTKAWGFWGSCMGIAMTAAPLLGGALMATLGWRWAFYINLPACLILIAAVLRWIPESRNQQAARLDPIGSILFSGGLSLIIWGLIASGDAGWTTLSTMLKLGLGTALLGVFIPAQLWQKKPMVDLHLFRSPRFVGAVLAMFGYAASAQVMMSYLPLYLQNAFGFTPVVAGLALMPFALGMVVFPRVGQRLGAFMPLYAILALGLAIVGVGNWFSAWAAGTHAYGLVALGMLITGSGTGLLNGNTQKGIMSNVPQERSGMGSGISATTRFTGIVLAVARLGSILSARTLSLFKGKVHLVDSGLHLSSKHMVTRIIVGDANHTLAELPIRLHETVAVAARESFVGGFSTALIVVGGVAVLCAALVCLLMKQTLHQGGTKLGGRS